MVISITEAKYIGEYKIVLLFYDGVEKIIDFESFLKFSKNPMTRKLLDLQLFKDFKIKYGDLIWNDFELCFPIWDLHEGKI